jgi:hypothetical protein
LEENKYLAFLINRLPPLRELDLYVVPPGIQDGHLRHLESLRVDHVGDWSCLLRETVASLIYLYVKAGHAVSSVGHTNLCSQDTHYGEMWDHVAKLTNLVSLSVKEVDWWIDPSISFLEMLSNLAHLETLHLSSISQHIYDHMVSTI